MWVTNDQKRIPDMALFTRQQIVDATDNTEPIPAFVIELISPTDRAGKVEKKVIEYFSAGVQVIWHIYPALRMVRVFTSVKSNTTYFETDSLSAAPAVPDLQVTVDEVFSR